MKKVILILCFALAGCATVGKTIDQSKLSQIKEGVTTKDGVVALLGKPVMVNLTSDGKTVMTYQYVKVSNRPQNFIPGVDLLAGGMDMNQQILQVLLTSDDKVEKYVFSDGNTPMNYGLLNTNK